MSIRVLCPNLKCRALLTVPDDARGQRVRCGHCGATLLVPGRDAPRQQSAAAPAPPRNQTP